MAITCGSFRMPFFLTGATSHPQPSISHSRSPDKLEGSWSALYDGDERVLHLTHYESTSWGKEGIDNEVDISDVQPTLNPFRWHAIDPNKLDRTFFQLWVRISRGSNQPTQVMVMDNRGDVYIFKVDGI